MGKIRVKHLGIEEIEEQERKKRQRQREQKQIRKEGTKKKKDKGVERTPGLKGGERVVSMTSEEDIARLAKISQEQEKLKKDTHDAGKKQKKISRRQRKHKRSRAYRKAQVKIEKTKEYSISEAVRLLKETSIVRFNGTVEVHINTAKTGIRGTVNLPHGTGKKIRVAIADEDLLKHVEQGKIDFDILVAHPSLMPKIAKVAKILGPKGLMPNPKAGTISSEPDKAAKELKSGKIEYKTEVKQPIIHQVIGKVDFDEKKLIENFQTLIDTIGKKHILSVTLASTMSPGIKVAIV